jgi:hypothetical protein
MPPISVTYQRRLGGAWVVYLSTGEQLTVATGRDEAGLGGARATVRRHTGGGQLGVERVDTTTHGIDWHGLRFEALATTFGIADPTPAQREQLAAC